MRKNKMGSLFLISVLALAGIGVSYAGWTDTITVTGTVETGDVDINVYNYSGTWVWKYIPEHGLIWHHSFAIAPDYNMDPMGFYGSNDHLLVASAWAEPGAEDDSVKVTFDNLFPCQDFTVDFLMHYDGSIPARLQGPILINTYNLTGAPLPEFKNSGYNWLEYLWYVESQNGVADGGIEVVAYYTDQTGTVVGDPIDVGSQFEFCDWIYVKLTIHIPQDPDYMNLEGAFDTMFEVIQWNEFGDPAGGCGGTTISEHADVMLTIDTSGSISGYEAPLLAASKAFVTALLSDDGQVGIVAFNYSAYLLSTFSIDETALHNIIDGLNFYGLTNLEDAIITSQNELATADRTPDATYQDYMVIITDGNPTTGGDPLDDATAAKAAGTRIFVLGVGIPDATLLTQIASPGDYYDVADWPALQNVLLGLIGF